MSSPVFQFSLLADVTDKYSRNIVEKNFLRDLVIGLFQLSGLPDDPDNLVECFQEIRWMEENAPVGKKRLHGC